jgi:hypothetical protein
MPRTKRLGSKDGALPTARRSPARAVDDHAGRRLAFHARVREGLEARVERELQVGALDPFHAVDLAHDAAHGVDFDALGPGLAAQLLLQLGLDARLADGELRDLHEGVGIFHEPEVVVAHGAT